MRFITYEQAEQIPAFQGKTPAQVAGLVADATLLWRYIQGHAWATDEALREYATDPAQGLDTDRVNAALALLRQTQRIFGFDDTPIAPVAAGVPPSVVAQSPAPGATGVDVGTPVYAQLSQALDASAVGPGSLVLATAAGQVQGSVAYEPATLRVVFTPAAALDAATAYSATLAAGVANGSGLQLGTDVSWDFTTA
jgi:hypothetical protein